jgi:N-acetylglucosaminyldiphosphoundecaprenol N-acetyl-beta-D-mannosaminyltransferase
MINKKIDFLGVDITPLTLDEIVNKILDFSLKGKHKTAAYVNAHCMNLALNDRNYKYILNKIDLVYAGGMGVVLASKLFKDSLPERVNILDFFDELAEKLRINKIKIYLLGDTIDIVQKAGNALKEKFSLKIIGCHSGYFNEKEEVNLIKEVNFLKPDILMVGMGVPRQEKWIFKHINELDVNLCWAIGGVFKIFSGKLRKTPRWISKSGMEWLYLGIQEPSRFFNRYLSGNFVFIFRTIKYKINIIKNHRKNHV